KIFINLCSHQIIPFKAEVRSTIDVHKTIFMLVSLPLEYQNEKDLSYCIIYDIVVNPDEIYMTNIDSSGAARHRICTQALELIASSYYENLDPSYVILRLASNYKGKDDSGKSTVRSIIIPSPEAFFSFKQIACGAPSAESAPLTASTSSRKGSTTVTSEANSVKSAPNAAPSSSLNGSTRSSTAPTTVPSATSTAILTNLTAQWASNSTIYQLLLTHGESKNLTIDKTIKAMVVPRENLEKFDNRSFNIVLDLMSSHEVNLRDLFVFPETGFVILAEKLKPIVPLYINVCHHPLIGQILYSAGSNNFTYGGKRSVSNDNGSISLNDPIPSPCPYILGKVTERVLDPSSGQSVMSVDVVIPSNVMANAIADSTGELRDRVSNFINFLKNLLFFINYLYLFILVGN
ncbi:hypothetical protein M1146_04260, partial [Patescibacteria group bacterium]|nr:hypothetical protein [Patescibacteria group bacterium]